LGATPVRGSLTTFSTLTSEAAKADAVLHCAFIHDFESGWDAVLKADRDAISALAAGLKGSGKALVVSSGSGGRAPDPNGGEVDETAGPDPNFPLTGRTDAEDFALAKSKDGIRVSVIRVAPFAYGRGGSTFIPWLMGKAVASGESLYVGDGSNHVTGIHIDDLADLYLKVAEKGSGLYNGTSSTNFRAKELAGAIGEVLGVKTRGVEREEASKEERLGMILALFLGMECRNSSKKARVELGWSPRGVDLISDVARGSYRETAAKLKQK
jgi:nucleoside-diphosphate-sugar epimerase